MIVIILKSFFIYVLSKIFMAIQILYLMMYSYIPRKENKYVKKTFCLPPEKGI